eukprot:c16508_g1_i2.p1 GENE.c16508_g1_i2~~c16508_g1_i2.p1  ORF type:complete len:196 (+),score=40.90 c16508_g1_i2:417-1004(+)
MTISLRFGHIHNEEWTDLLSSNPSSGPIRILPGGEVTGFTLLACATEEEARRALAKGRTNQLTHATNTGTTTSMSHMIVSLVVTTHDPTSPDQPLTGWLNFVELSGHAFAAQKSRVVKSSFALAEVLAALRNNLNFVPFRNSKLTYLLTPDLKTNAHVVLVAHLRQGHDYLDSTMRVLEYVMRCTKPTLNLPANS